MLSVAYCNITRHAYMVNLPFTTHESHIRADELRARSKFAIVLSAERCQSTRRLNIGSVFLSEYLLCHGVIVVRGKISSNTVYQLIHMSLCLLHCCAVVNLVASKFCCERSSFFVDSLKEPHCRASFAEGCETSCLTLPMHRLLRNHLKHVTGSRYAP